MLGKDLPREVCTTMLNKLSWSTIIRQWSGRCNDVYCLLGKGDTEPVDEEGKLFIIEESVE